VVGLKPSGFVALDLTSGALRECAVEDQDRGRITYRHKNPSPRPSARDMKMG